MSDITDFTPETVYDVWHDRATFRFLTTKEQIAKNQKLLRTAVRGYLIIGTFLKAALPHVVD